MVELADTGDLKSPGLKGLYGFDPRLRQDIQRDAYRGMQSHRSVHRHGGEFPRPAGGFPAGRAELLAGERFYMVAEGPSNHAEVAW